MKLINDLTNKWFDFVSKRKIIMVTFFILLFVSIFLMAFPGWIKPDMLIFLMILSFILSVLSPYTTAGKMGLVIGLLLMGTVIYVLWIVAIAILLYLTAKLLGSHRIKRLEKIANMTIEKLAGSRKKEERQEIIVEIEE